MGCISMPILYNAQLVCELHTIKGIKMIIYYGGGRKNLQQADDLPKRNQVVLF